MYLPELYKMSNREEILRFMRAYPFAAIITAKNGLPLVTHLPFVIEETGNGEITLTAHFAKANTQWKDIEENPVLVVFSEPHAYISPKHYAHEQNVPTWNYVSVHVYGKGHLITHPEAASGILGSTIRFYEQEYMTQWNSLPEAYKQKMLNGIVCFRITATDIQAKKKLSQNKTETERKNIFAALEHSANGSEQELAQWMKANEADLINK